MSFEKEILNEIVDYGDDSLFVVSLSISSAKKINLLVDSMKGITIGDCAKISRTLRKKFEEQLDEYELNVSSPGVDKAFLIDKQYEKNIGQDIEIILLSGEKHKGKLLKFQNNIIELEETKKVKKKNSKKKETVSETISVEKQNIKKTKLVLKFK